MEPEPEAGHKTMMETEFCFGLELVVKLAALEVGEGLGARPESEDPG